MFLNNILTFLGLKRKALLFIKLNKILSPERMTDLSRQVNKTLGEDYHVLVFGDNIQDVGVEFEYFPKPISDKEFNRIKNVISDIYSKRDDPIEWEDIK